MGILHSFSRKGNPYENACIESFHSVLKKEEIYLHTYRESSEVRGAIFEYIEGWYNRKRIHSAIGYMTPRQKTIFYEWKERRQRPQNTFAQVQKICCFKGIQKRRKAEPMGRPKRGDGRTRGDGRKLKRCRALIIQ